MRAISADPSVELRIVPSSGSRKRSKKGSGVPRSRQRGERWRKHVGERDEVDLIEEELEGGLVSVPQTVLIPLCSSARLA
jgi:hypothetical protein